MHSTTEAAATRACLSGVFVEKRSGVGRLLNRVYEELTPSAGLPEPQRQRIRLSDFAARITGRSYKIASYKGASYAATHATPNNLTGGSADRTRGRRMRLTLSLLPLSTSV
jgi:hypothetical protein